MCGPLCGLVGPLATIGLGWLNCVLVLGVYLIHLYFTLHPFSISKILNCPSGNPILISHLSSLSHTQLFSLFPPYLLSAPLVVAAAHTTTAFSLTQCWRYFYRHLRIIRTIHGKVILIKFLKFVHMYNISYHGEFKK